MIGPTMYVVIQTVFSLPCSIPDHFTRSLPCSPTSSTVSGCHFDLLCCLEDVGSARTMVNAFFNSWDIYVCTRSEDSSPKYLVSVSSGFVVYGTAKRITKPSAKCCSPRKFEPTTGPWLAGSSARDQQSSATSGMYPISTR